jgi:hypothetical protein
LEYREKNKFNSTYTNNDALGEADNHPQNKFENRFIKNELLADQILAIANILAKSCLVIFKIFNIF